MEINDSRCNHIYEVFEGEHFDNLQLSADDIANVMCRQFDLVEWIMVKTIINDNDKFVQVCKTYLDCKQPHQLVYIIIPIDSHNDESSLVRFFNPIVRKQQNEVILLKRTIEKCGNTVMKGVSRMPLMQIYDVYTCARSQIGMMQANWQTNQISQKQLRNIFKHSLGVIYIQFKAHIVTTSSTQSHSRMSKIQIKIIEHISQLDQFQSKCFIEYICKIFKVPDDKLFHSHNFNPKSFSGSSFLVIDQGTAIPYLKDIGNHNSHLNKNQFTYIFREPHQLTTKKQLQQLVVQYADIIFDKTTHQNETKLNSIEQQSSHSHLIEKTPNNHFICSASNAFIPFLLSISQKIGKQKVIEYLFRYINITNPSYDSCFRLKTNGQRYIKLSQQKADEIKRSLSILLSRLILQYSKQISAIASQLSFIFEIVELLNKSMLTKEFIQKLLELFIHFGGMCPDVLLSADLWIKEIENDKVKYKAELDGRGEQHKDKGLGYQYKLNGFIEAGRMTGLRAKLQPTLCEILYRLHAMNTQSLTFQEYFSLTSNTFTIVAFDITSRTVRFFNHLTTPTFNILHFLYMTQIFQSIQVVSDEWMPYKIVYQNQTVFVNLYQSILTPPIGIECLDQFTDNHQIHKMYFSSFHHKAETQLEFNKYVFNGRSVSHEVYQERQRQYNVKLHTIISSLKKLIFANIPKTKLIWRFIKFQAFNKQNLNDKTESVISILRKIQIVNHLYNMFKTMISHEKNLCREVWLQSQCNLLDFVRSSRLNIMQRGQQQGVIQWQMQRIKYLRKIIEQQLMIKVDENRTELNKWENILEYNLLGGIVNQSVSEDYLISDTEKIRISQKIKQNVSGCYNKLTNIQSNFSECKYFTSIKTIFKQCLKYIQQPSKQNLNKKEINQRLSIRNLTKHVITQNIIQKVRNISKHSDDKVLQVIRRINHCEVGQILEQVDKYIKLISKTLDKSQQGNHTSFSWFDTQLAYQKLLKSLFYKIYHAITIPTKPTLLKIYFCEVRQIQVYDLFMSNFTLIQDKLDVSMLRLRTESKFSKDILTRNKINLVVDGEDGSELHSYLYLKLIFDKLQKIESYSSSTLDKQTLKIKSHDFLNRNEQTVDYVVPLGKYFDSFTCCGFQSIAILELILQSNFHNGQTKKVQLFHSILHKILSYRHLLEWNPSQQIDQIFQQFTWHNLQQDQLDQFYHTVYTENYLKQIHSKTQLSASTLKQAEKNFNEKLYQKYKSQPLFSKKRRQTQTYLFYEVLQQWFSITLKRKNKQNQNLVQNEDLLNDLINSKILYNQNVINTYSILQKKQLVSIVKNFMQKFSPFFEEFISAAIDANPHSRYEWKGVILKNAISSFRLKIYLQRLFKSYDLDVDLTFSELYQLGKNKFQGIFNILLWNTSKNCIQVCNHITKPRMPVWFAILSTCSFPFYMHEQYSHKKWQVSQFPKTYPSFKQFPNRINQDSPSYSSQRIKTSNIVKTQPYQQLIPNLIDQQINTYLNPQLLEPFPLIYLTNPYLGIIRAKNAKILTISYKTINNQLTDRNRNKFFEEGEININLSNIFSLYFNKKDKNIKILRHYLRKKLKQTHFFSIFQALSNKNVNLYRYYNNLNNRIINSQTQQVARKCLSNLTSSDEQGQSTNSQTKNFTQEDKQYVKNNKKIDNFRVKISKLQVERMQNFSEKNEITEKCKIDSKKNYKFYKTFSQIQRQKSSEIPQLSSKGLKIDTGDNPQSLSFDQILEKGPQLKHQSKLAEQKPKRKQKRIRKIISKFIISCKCFGFSSDKGQKSIQKKNNS